MKKIIIAVVIMTTAIMQTGLAQDTTTQSQFPQLLNSYYEIKDALVAGNAGSAALNAVTFVKIANDISSKNLFEDNPKILLKDAAVISETTDIKTQRERFAALSSNMIAMAEKIKLTSETVYMDYCPMKKAYWLSSEKDIKNPYYGSAMLTCGSVKDTLK
ncbi:MAG: DUF3347 domain-containing protein [Chitinophagales bacterium]